MKKKTKSKKQALTFQERIGIKRVGTTLSKESCKARATQIRRLVDKHEISAEARRKLLKQAAWYAWRANQGGFAKRKAA